VLTLSTKVYCKYGGIKAIYTAGLQVDFKRYLIGIPARIQLAHLSIVDPYLNLIASRFSQHRSTTAPEEKRIKSQAGQACQRCFPRVARANEQTSTAIWRLTQPSG
jgi:hypothetical protein